jgi:hypothetical protein
MTATLPARGSRSAAHRPAAPAPRTPRATAGATARATARATTRATARRALLATPAKLRAVLVSLVLLSLAWGAFGGWVATRHSSAADSLATTDEGLSLSARHVYQSVADADATITAAFLASPQPALSRLQRYDLDLATATSDLSRLQAAIGGQAAGSALAQLGSGLPAYAGYVAEAKSEYAMGFPLTGGSFLQVASEQAHLVLLPAANSVYTQENEALSASSDQATELWTVIAALVLAVITAFALYRAQRWLGRRTNRVLSPGLVIASLLLVVTALWLAAGFLGARSDLDRAISRGSGPANRLALASIGVQQIRGDAVLNVISRSGNASFQDDFLATSKKLGPGDGSWLADAAAGQEAGGPGAALVATAERDVTAWYTANRQVYKLGAAANYAGERDLVVGGVPGNTLTGYNSLEGDLTQAIGSDESVFKSAAADGVNALGPLAGVVIAASVLMALCCVWAVSRRLAEYR